ncbi:hypothetical protein MPER_12574 [Moniliophthora perniciosa FA553]|nr:hypothetical protein MPER_12574 [Moniliophthora perniciosa FA553]
MTNWLFVQRSSFPDPSPTKTKIQDVKRFFSRSCKSSRERDRDKSGAVIGLEPWIGHSPYLSEDV